MQYKPYAYQEYACKRILDIPRGGLFLDMGLGKTVITLTALNELIYNRFEISKVLVIAPLRVAESTWSDECEKWAHLRHLKISKILGGKQARLKALYANADVYIVNRENVPWLVDELTSSAGNAWFFDMVVIDELSSFKSPKAQRFKSLRRQILKSQRVVGLTGTPAPNGLIDLWSQVYLLDGGERLGKTVTGYRDAFFTPGRRNASVIFDYNLKSGAEQAVMSRIEDICVSMKAEDFLDLPERVDVVRHVELSPKELKRYRDFEKQAYLAIEETEINAVNAAALTNKLLQFANGAVYDDNRQWTEVSKRKLDVLDEIVETAQGQPVLCFYNFKHDLARIVERHKGARLLLSHEDLREWNEGKIPLLLAHPKSAGHGLNLQKGGSIIVWFGLNWSLEEYTQANARLHRQGQTNKVIIHHLVAKNTVDEAVMQALAQKSSVQDAVLAAVKARVKEQRIEKNYER